MNCTLGRITWSLQYVALYLRPVRHRCGIYVGPHVNDNGDGQNFNRHRKKHTTSSSQSQIPQNLNPKVPQTPTWECVTEDQLPPPTKVPPDLVDKLERLALLDFRNQDGVDCLEKAIRFADQLHVVNTDGVEPMDSVLEDRAQYLRDDRIEEGDCAEQLLGLAKNTLEGYYVAPPGEGVLWLGVCANKGSPSSPGATMNVCKLVANTLHWISQSFSLTGNIPLPEREEREALLKYSEM